MDIEVFVFESYDEFLESVNPIDSRLIETQCLDLMEDCFDERFTPNIGPLIIAFDGDQIVGLLNEDVAYAEMTFINNACVHRNYRRRGVLGHLMSKLSPNLYYLLSIDIDNIVVFHAYCKYMDFDRVGLGYPSFQESSVAFVVGGRLRGCVERNNVNKEINTMMNNFTRIIAVSSAKLSLSPEYVIRILYKILVLNAGMAKQYCDSNIAPKTTEQRILSNIKTIIDDVIALVNAQSELLSILSIMP